ncbi:PLP-dependent decarboxylase [Ferrimonas pelagia]|uniref:Type III PLP-dependent enzyme n=1 Tax=Ferrimonas pelagia TaxID=1177826 RepID=A0ABP9EBW3_9GAMM
MTVCHEHYHALHADMRLALDACAHQLDHSFYAYDLDGLDSHLATLKQAQAKLWFAVKANPVSAVIQSLAAQGFGFDVASPGELNQVLAQGVSPDRILNTGPVKTPAMLREFLQKGVRIFVLESHQQVHDLEAEAKRLDLSVDVLLRVQLPWPKSDDGSINVLGGSDPTPFGLTPEQWLPTEIQFSERLQLRGVHCFQWGNILDADELIANWQGAMPRLAALLDAWQIAEPVVDLGGGLGIPYTGQSDVIDWQQVCTALAQLKQQYNLGECWMELGRYAVGPYGYYVSRVADVKQNQGVTFVVIEGGSQHALRPALTNQAFPVQPLHASEAAPLPVQIHGSLCTGLDCLGKLSLPGDVKRDDWLVFSQAGAYGFTESMPFFLCHSLPAEVTLRGAELTVVRPAAPAASYLA